MFKHRAKDIERKSLIILKTVLKFSNVNIIIVEF